MCGGDSWKAKLLTLCVAVGYLLALAMAGSPELHHKLHHDADDSDHHCLASAVADAQFDGVSTAPVAVQYVPIQIGLVDFSMSARELPGFSSAFLLEHAPPRA